MDSSPSTMNIEQQILKVIASTVPIEAKKTLIDYCCKHSLEILEKETCHGVLKLAIHWIIYESDTLLNESGRKLLQMWAQNKTPALVSFFTESVLLTLLKVDAQPSRILYVLSCVFPHLKTSSKSYPRLCKLVSHELTTWLKINDIEFCGSLAMFLKENTECLAVEKDELSRINILFIQCLGKTKIPNASKVEMKVFFNMVECICELSHIIWGEDSSGSFIRMSVKECFEILSNPNYTSTVALTTLTNYMPDDVVNAMIHDVAASSAISDKDIFSGLSKMLQWLVWPKKTKVVSWLLSFFKYLARAGKKKIMQHLILEKILQVFSRVYMPVIRESNFVILVNMLINSLDSPAAFHKVIPFVPNLLDRLKREKKEQSNYYYTALGELMYTLIYRFPDRTGLVYAPLLLALKDIPRPTVDMMNKWLQSVNAGFPREQPETDFTVTPELLTVDKDIRKTGLVNLGNTCYMNSILQCLFMLNVFRSALFTRAASLTRHPVMYSLQDVFAFLLMSKRDAIAPENFVRRSRPPWFPAGTQQDCCEFVHYLMDKLEEDDKCLLHDGNDLPTPTTNIVEEHFKGVLSVTYKCMSCENESKHKEDFTDILLAFPEVVVADDENPDAFKTTKFSRESENPESLKGGDQIQNFPERRFKDTSFQTSKESVSNVQTTPKASTNVMAVVKHDAGERSTFTIQEMLDYFMKPEELSGNNQYFCDECRANVDGERHVQIAKLPNFLVLCLKRFSFDVKSQTKPKLLHVVDYPEELTFCSVGESIKLGPKACSEIATDDVAMKEEDGETMETSAALHSYKLCSVVVHSGLTCEAGHYYSYAFDIPRNVDGATRPQWYCFNDENTHETSYKDFLERERSSVTDTTYIVIYMNEELGKPDEADHHGRCDIEAPAEMVERVQQDNFKYLQERLRHSVEQLPSVGRSKPGDGDKDDDPPPPGNCGSNGSNFAIPGNRFIC